MRDYWYFHLAVGWYKLSIAERGFVTTLYSLNERFTAIWEDVDTVFGLGWRNTADKLVGKRVIKMETKQNGSIEFSLLLKNAKRRIYNKNYAKQKSRGEGTAQRKDENNE